MRDDEYDELVDAFVDALAARCPRVLLQWEDFAQRNANRLLTAHRDRICSFNDDIQGTAAVAVAAIVGGMRISRDTARRPARGDRRRRVRPGSGSPARVVGALVLPGCPVDEARQRCWLVDRDGLLHDRLDGLVDFQTEFVRPWESVAALADERRPDRRCSMSFAMSRHTRWSASPVSPACSPRR